MKKSEPLRCGFMLLGLDQQSSAKSKASLQFRLDQHLWTFVQTMNVKYPNRTKLWTL
jgi:hypothetical protein